MKIDVIIPVYKPQRRFLELICMLEKQTCPVNRIILMNTEQKAFAALCDEQEFLNDHPKVQIHHLSKEEFDHGATRNAGVSHSDGDIFVCMTQDALPADIFLLEQLQKALEQPGAAAAYARQLAEEDCNPVEGYTRQFNYGEQSVVKGKEDLERLGIKTYFCSNVCAAYRREIFDRLGGFVNRTIFNEDMIYAGKAVQNGYKIVYAADAKVIHSHNYTAWQQFTRNFDLGVSHVQYPEIFAGVKAEGEGLRLVLDTGKYLVKHHPLLLWRLFVHSGAKFAGYKMGRLYQKLPMALVKCFSMQKSYWEHTK